MLGTMCLLSESKGFAGWATERYFEAQEKGDLVLKKHIYTNRVSEVWWEFAGWVSWVQNFL